jgi:hypothetical protein
VNKPTRKTIFKDIAKKMRADFEDARNNVPHRGEAYHSCHTNKASKSLGVIILISAYFLMSSRSESPVTR